MRRVKEGTSALLLQSGLNGWWADSLECYSSYLRNVTVPSNGKTPYERRFGQPVGGPVIPFGSLVEYHLKTDQSRIHQFGKKVLLGCSTDAHCARGMIKDASEICSQRLESGRGDISQIRNLFFQLQMDESKYLEEIRKEHQF